MDKNPDYFEGVLQLRNPTQEIIDFVADAIDKEENVWIASTNKQKNGIDLVLSSNKFLRKIGKKLKDNFPGELTESKSLFTMHKLTSRHVFRGCVLFRHCNLKKGDKFPFKGEEHTVISLGREIIAKNPDNRNVHIAYKDI